jgi:hypothetical protein
LLLFGSASLTANDSGFDDLDAVWADTAPTILADADGSRLTMREAIHRFRRPSRSGSFADKGLIP